MITVKFTESAQAQLNLNTISPQEQTFEPNSFGNSDHDGFTQFTPVDQGTIYRVQNGFYAGPEHFGVESLYRHPGSRWVISVHVGAVSGDEVGSFGRDWFPMMGSSIGKDIALRETSSDGLELYFRISQGFGIAARNFFSNQTTVAYFGGTTSALFGIQYRITDRSALFMHGGGRAYYFPALNEINFKGLPVLSFGIQFSSSVEVPMSRF
ncbi:MAG: hypothetical protein JJU46_05585 [Balneolaceae bacterium]|nr:hypothetical protein [Balneolaceae bacterium]